jgi:hypothetical protein
VAVLSPEQPGAGTYAGSIALLALANL